MSILGKNVLAVICLGYKKLGGVENVRFTRLNEDLKHSKPWCQKGEHRSKKKTPSGEG